MLDASLGAGTEDAPGHRVYQRGDLRYQVRDWKPGVLDVLITKAQ